MNQKKHSIELVFFSGKSKPFRTKALNIVEKLFSREQISIYTNLESFSSGLLQPGYNHKIILILINTQKDLSGILGLKKLLNDRNIILLLPDTEKETMGQACKLYPRYTSDIQSNFKDVIPVMEKMITKIQETIKGEKND